jgi:hypothetical protein
LQHIEKDIHLNREQKQKEKVEEREKTLSLICILTGKEVRGKNKKARTAPDLNPILIISREWSRWENNYHS